MGLDTWIRRGALGAIPLTALVMYLARRPAPAEIATAPAASGASAPLPAPAEPRGLGPLSSALAERGEAALRERSEPLPPVAPKAKPHAVPAVELPLAQDEARSHPVASQRPRAGSCGGVEARLITASEDPSWAFASLSPAPGEPAVIRHQGERIGGYQVDRIEWDRVWLRGAGSRCAATLNLGAREEDDTRGKHKLADEKPGEQLWRVPGEIANAIEKLSETEYSVERGLVPAIYAQAGALLYGLEIEPVRKDEQVVALTLGEIRTDSLLERLGVETGDRVLSIDGQPVSSLDTVVKALRASRENERLVAKLERDGQAFELRVVAR